MPTTSDSEIHPDAKPREANAEPSIPDIINSYTARIRGIRRCANEHIRLATESTAEWSHRFAERIQAVIAEHGDDAVGSQKILEFFRERSVQDEVHYHHVVPHSDIIAQSLLIFGFSALDAYLGILLKRLYRQEKNLLYKLNEKEIKVSELLQMGNVDDVLNAMIERDISALLRKGYDESFGIISNRHGVSTLKTFKSWATFIEASQRRNLITHCDGVVSAQYISACKDAGVKLGNEVAIGTKLAVDAAYLQNCFEVLYEVGLKIGVILWRVASSDYIAPAEVFLTDELFQLLVREDWQLATVVGEFAVTLPKQQSDLQNRISRINYAQALKWSGDAKRATGVLDASLDTAFRSGDNCGILSDGSVH